MLEMSGTLLSHVCNKDTDKYDVIYCRWIMELKYLPGTLKKNHLDEKEPIKEMNTSLDWIF